MALIVAELGVNHGGKIDNAKRLIEAAMKAGADVVKFQTYDADTLEPPGDRREILRELQLPRYAYHELKAYAEACGLEFMSTPFDVASLWFLVNDVAVKRLKISSGDLTNKDLLAAARASKLPVILSTGMGTLSQVASAILGLREVTLLHCVSAYPAPVESLNLRAVQTLRERFRRPVGFSNHALSLIAPAIAVVLGATVIETHLTLNRNAYGPDHKASFEPTMFAKMVENIKEAEASLGSGEKKPQACEREVQKIVQERAEWRAACAS